MKMTRMRKRTAERLKDSQNTAAMLTTFNEIDMSNIIEFRNQHKDAFLKRHGVKLGFMSAFAKASAFALQKEPAVNAFIDTDNEHIPKTNKNRIPNCIAVKYRARIFMG